MSAGMLGFQLPFRLAMVAAVLLSVMASGQCVARCAMLPCGRPASSDPDLPPCHRHRSPAPKPCLTPVFVADGRPQTAPRIGDDAMHATATDVAFGAWLAWHPAAQQHPPSPPPESGSPYLVILRV